MNPPEPTTTPSQTERSERRLVRAETVIAILALLTSACASVAALWQSREAVVQTRATIAQTQTLANQLRASVWPYLTIDYNFAPTHVELDLVNQGLGPALIRTFTYSIDRRTHQHIREIANYFDPNTRGRSVGENDFGAGSVIRPSQTFMIFTIADAKLRYAHASDLMARTQTHICYCSLLADCWNLDSAETEPKMVRACGPSAKRTTL